MRLREGWEIAGPRGKKKCAGEESVRPVKGGAAEGTVGNAYRQQRRGGNDKARNRRDRKTSRRCRRRLRRSEEACAVHPKTCAAVSTTMWATGRPVGEPQEHSAKVKVGTSGDNRNVECTVRCESSVGDGARITVGALVGAAPTATPKSSGGVTRCDGHGICGARYNEVKQRRAHGYKRNASQRLRGGVDI